MSKENLLHQEDDFRSEFRRHFPSGTIIPLEASQIRDRRVRRYFRMDDPTEGGGDLNFAVRHPDESTTYAFATYDPDTTVVGEMGFIDISPRGLVAGYGSMMFGWIGENAEQLIAEVRWTDTVRHMRRRGLGTRRLELMNAFARTFRGVPLQSDWPTESATGVWQKLVNQERATTTEHGDFIFR